MSNYYIVNPIVGAPGPVTATHSSPQFPLGLEVFAADKNAATGTAAAPSGGVFVYCRGSNMASAGQFVHVVNGSAVLLASANSASAYPVGVGAGALTATNVYGWVQVQGRCDYAIGTNTAPVADKPVYFCATAGIVVSNVGAGSRIVGVVGNAAVTATSGGAAGKYVYDLARPFNLGATGNI